ncbi:DUF58 domain-containing protein [Exiguobacterium sp. s16]|uniref:DUF58 domain-containing protein n=1 Tax=Exiguobacterium sp. s16 TaxID=2751237 RepID=UPI001BE73476|nr:DUF58 domain-containing protein [Exiguobacterium sp. s16]
MRQVEVSSPSLLEDKLWPAYTSVMLLVVWFPYVWPVAYVCGALLGLMVARNWMTKQIEQHVHVTFKQKEQLLFIEDTAVYQVNVTGLKRLKTLGLPLSLRFGLQPGLTFTEGGGTHTIQVISEEPRYSISIQAVKRGPTGVSECVLSVRLPFRLGVVLLVEPVKSLPNWTILPSIKKMSLSDSKQIRIGDRIVKHSPLKDPLMVLSSKSYEAEPVKQIDWIATARTGKMQAKVFQRQNVDTFTLMLDLNTPQGNGLHARFEELIQQASYVVSYLVKEECKVELFINRLDRINQIDHLHMNEGRKQLRLSLMRLAVVKEQDQFVASERFSRIVESRKHAQSELITINHALLINP